MAESQGIENLRPWKAGESGNPHGRPKKPYSLTAMLRDRGEQLREDGRTWAQALSDKMWDMAVEEGDKAIGQYVMNRLEGMPKERVEHSESHVSQIVLVTNDGSQGTAEAEAVPSNPE